MLTELCQELNNWFPLEKLTGTFTIEGGMIAAPFLRLGQYYRIIGSVFNDGVHRYPDCELCDEVFEGAVWAMAVPSAVLQLSDEIDAWKAKYEAVDSPAMSPYQSESFGGYSYTKASGPSYASGLARSGWRSTFAPRLNAWRKLK